MTAPNIENESNDGSQSGSKVAMGCGLGCLAAVVVCVAVALIAIHMMQTRVNEFAENASSEPVTFSYPKVQVAEAEQVINRFEDFREAIAADRAPAEPLILSSDEINILIDHHRDLEPLAGKMQVSIENNLLRVKGSLKPSDLPFEIPFLSKAFEGKYINADVVSDFSLADENLQFELREIDFAGTPLPKEILPKISDELMGDLRSDEQLTGFLDKMETIKIKDDRVYLIPEPANP